MPRPLEDRVTVEASPAALVICFLVGRGPFQDAMAEPVNNLWNSPAGAPDATPKSARLRLAMIAFDNSTSPSE